MADGIALTIPMVKEPELKSELLKLVKSVPLSVGKQLRVRNELDSGSKIAFSLVWPAGETILSVSALIEIRRPMLSTSRAKPSRRKYYRRPGVKGIHILADIVAKLSKSYHTVTMHSGRSPTSTARLDTKVYSNSSVGKSSDTSTTPLVTVTPKYKKMQCHLEMGSDAAVLGPTLCLQRSSVIAWGQGGNGELPGKGSSARRLEEDDGLGAGGKVRHRDLQAVHISVLTFGKVWPGKVPRTAISSDV